MVVARGVFRKAALPVVLMSTVHRSVPIRFSSSAVLRVTSGQDYLVTKTPARGESVEYWGPLGGVIKCKSGAAAKLLADMEVTFDVLADQHEDMNRDLRVKMGWEALLAFRSLVLVRRRTRITRRSSEAGTERGTPRSRA